MYTNVDQSTNSLLDCLTNGKCDDRRSSLIPKGFLVEWNIFIFVRLKQLVNSVLSSACFFYTPEIIEQSGLYAILMDERHEQRITSIV